MQKLYLLIAALCITTFSLAQADTAKKENDTIIVGGMIIIKTPGEKGSDFPDERKRIHFDIKSKKKYSKISTNFLVLDLGFNNINDKTNYSSPAVQQLFDPAGSGNEDWFDLRNGKSINVNIWFFMQRLSLSKNVLNLKYGLGIEMYNFRYSQPLRLDTDLANSYLFYLDKSRNYSKNKLATDYLTVPVMLNVDFTPKKRNSSSFGLSAGASFGYLYSSRQKFVTSEDGKNKEHNNFDLEKFRIAYIAELQLGPVRLYGSYTSKSIFKNEINQVPYAIGLRFSNW